MIDKKKNGFNKQAISDEIDGIIHKLKELKRELGV